MTAPRTDAKGITDASIAGLRWVALSRAVVQIVTWVLTIAIVRLLSPADYGLMTLSGLIVLFAGMLLDGGLGAAFVHRRDVPDRVLVAANTAVTLGSIILVLVVQAIAGPSARFFSEPLLEPVLRVASLQFVISALTVVPNSLLMARMGFRSLATTQAISGIAQSVFTLLLALLGAGVWSLVLGGLLAGLVRLIATWTQARPPIGVSRDFQLLKPYVAFSAYIVGQRLLWFWAQQVDTLIVGRMLGAQVLGLFSVAKNMAHMPLDRIGEIVNQVSFPAFASLQHDREAWVSAFEKVLLLSAAFTFPLFWGLAAVSPAAMQLLLGNKWLDTIIPFALFCLILPLRTVQTLTASILVGLGRTDVSFKNVVLWALVLPPAILAGSRYGMTGVAAAWALAFPVIFLLGSIRVAHALALRPAQMLRPLLLPAACASIMALTVFGVGRIFADRSAVMRLALETLTGLATYPLALRLLARQVFADCYRMSRQLLWLDRGNRQRVNT
jgi:O-antigen/teichoic acid export membrane protein